MSEIERFRFELAKIANAPVNADNSAAIILQGWAATALKSEAPITPPEATPDRVARYLGCASADAAFEKVRAMAHEIDRLRVVTTRLQQALGLARAGLMGTKDFVLFHGGESATLDAMLDKINAALANAKEAGL